MPGKVCATPCAAHQSLNLCVSCTGPTIYIHNCIYTLFTTYHATLSVTVTFVHFAATVCLTLTPLITLWHSHKTVQQGGPAALLVDVHSHAIIIKAEKLLGISVSLRTGQWSYITHHASSCNMPHRCSHFISCQCESARMPSLYSVLHGWHCCFHPKPNASYVPVRSTQH